MRLESDTVPGVTALPVASNGVHVACWAYIYTDVKRDSYAQLCVAEGTPVSRSLSINDSVSY